MNTLNTPVLPIAIVRTHPRHRNQSAATITLLNHVANQPGGCTAGDLLPVYQAAKAHDHPECATAENLRNMLYKLAGKNHLISEGRGQSCLWHLGAQACTTRHGQVEIAATYVGQRAPRAPVRPAARPGLCTAAQPGPARRQPGLSAPAQSRLRLLRPR